MDMTQIRVAINRVTKVWLSTLLYMPNIVSLDHEIISLPFTGGILCGHQMSLRNWVIIKVAFRYL